MNDFRCSFENPEVRYETWQFHDVVVNQIVNFETKLWISRRIFRWEVAKFAASEVRVIRCSWFGNITTNKFKQSEKNYQPGRAYVMMFTSEIKMIWEVQKRDQHLQSKRLLSWFFDRTGWFWQPLNFASAASVCNGLKQIIFFGAFSIFESGGITKHLMTGPSENSEFCFPSTSMFPSAPPRGTLRVSGKQNLLFPLWPVIKCLIFGVVFFVFKSLLGIEVQKKL